MIRYYDRDLTVDPNSPFVRDGRIWRGHLIDQVCVLEILPPEK
jgi:hypothetical protein